MSEEMEEVSPAVKAESDVTDGTTVWDQDGAGGDETKVVNPVQDYPATPQAWTDVSDDGFGEDPSWRHALKRSAPVLFVLALVTVVIAVGGFLWVDHESGIPSKLATVTVTAPSPPTPDERFIAELASHGISGGSLETANQYFMELAHYVCYRLLPPDPQPRGPEVDNVVAAENKNVDDGGHMMKFSHVDGEHLVDAAIDVYCPHANRT